MSVLERLYRDAPDAASYARAYLQHLARVLEQIDEQAVGAFIERLLTARLQQQQILVFGNGGSAATATHLANDLANGVEAATPPFRARSLTDNTATLTALANDYGYEEIFVRQLRGTLAPGDVIIAISASGNSPNVLKAVEYARDEGATIVAFTGFDGGALRTLADISLHVPTEEGEYGPVEDLHLVFDHIVYHYLKHRLQP